MERDNNAVTWMTDHADPAGAEDLDRLWREAMLARRRSGLRAERRDVHSVHRSRWRDRTPGEIYADRQEGGGAS